MRFRSRFLPAAALGAAALVVLSAAAPAAAHAQQQLEATAMTPSGAARDSVHFRRAASPDATKRRSFAPLFYVGMAAGTAFIFADPIDHDPGGYKDGLRTDAMFPDKAVHALSAWFLTDLGIEMGARPWHAATAVCAAGALFEVANGFVSHYDIGADCVGAALKAMWHERTHDRMLRGR